MIKTIAATTLALTLPLAVQAAPVAVDLTGWTAEEGNGGTAANWVVQTGNDSVLQTRNSRPSVFFDTGTDAQGTALKGSITVETTGDDDFIGFVLGYNAGEFDSATADFWLIDWKQNNQTFSGEFAGAGLALSHVTGDVATADEDDFWGHVRTVSEVQRATNLGSTGWLDNTTYSFELTFQPNLISVSVNGNVELSYTSAMFGSTFTDGAFGFYNYSQDRVRYAGITEEVLPPSSEVPLPASLPLLLAGIGGVAALRRRKG